MYSRWSKRSWLQSMTQHLVIEWAPNAFNIIKNTPVFLIDSFFPSQFLFANFLLWLLYNQTSIFFSSTIFPIIFLKIICLNHVQRAQTSLLEAILEISAALSSEKIFPRPSRCQHCSQRLKFPELWIHGVVSVLPFYFGFLLSFD